MRISRMLKLGALGLLVTLLLAGLMLPVATAFADALPNPLPSGRPPSDHPGHDEARTDPSVDEDVSSEYYLDDYERYDFPIYEESIWESLRFVRTGVFSFFAALLISLFIKVPIVAAAGGDSAGSWKSSVLVNTLTNPVAQLILALPFWIINLLWASGLSTGWKERLLFSWWWIEGLRFGPASIFAPAVMAAVIVVERKIFCWVFEWTAQKALKVALIANIATLCAVFIASFIW